MKLKAQAALLVKSDTSATQRMGTSEHYGQTMAQQKSRTTFLPFIDHEPSSKLSSVFVVYALRKSDSELWKRNSPLP